MKKRKSLALMGVLALFLFHPIEGVGEKPSGPLELILVADSPLSIGAEVRMTFTVTARFEISELAVFIELPEGLSHTEGHLEWSGPVAKDQPVSLKVTLGPLQDRSYEVVGRATAKLRSGATWTQAAATYLNPGSPPPPQTEDPKMLPRLKRDRQGEPILEVPSN